MDGGDQSGHDGLVQMLMVRTVSESTVRFITGHTVQQPTAVLLLFPFFIACHFPFLPFTPSQEITGKDLQPCRQMLEDNSWNLEVAVEQMLVRASYMAAHTTSPPPSFARFLNHRSFFFSFFLPSNH